MLSKQKEELKRMIRETQRNNHPYNQTTEEKLENDDGFVIGER